MEELVPLLSEVIESGGELRLSPRGTSMLPLLREGRDSVALVAPTEVTKGDICLYRRASGQYVLHRLMRFEEGEPVFCGDNQLAFEHGVKREEILARVSAVYRGERRVSVDSFFYRLYRFFHCLMPLRHLAFLPRRVWAKIKPRQK
jgi:hypothetical protein